MIKINLATRKESGLVGQGAKTPASLGGMNVNLSKVNFDELKNLPIRKIIVPLAVCLIASYGLDIHKENEMIGLEEEAAKLQEQNKKLQVTVSNFKSYDTLKKSLDEDQLVIRTKLDTIRKLAGDRSFVPKLLVFISSSIPSNVWLSVFDLKDSDLKIVGSALGYHEIYDFMKILNDNPELKDVNIRNNQQNPSSQGGSKSGAVGLEMANFEFEGKRR